MNSVEWCSHGRVQAQRQPAFRMECLECGEEVFAFPGGRYEAKDEPEYVDDPELDLELIETECGLALEAETKEGKE